MKKDKQDISDNRAYNLGLLIKEEGSQKALALKVGVSPVRINQVTAKRNRKNIGEDFAHRIEDVFNKPRGWLDKCRSPEVQEGLVDSNLAIDTFIAILEYLNECGVDPARMDKKAFRRMTEQTLARAVTYEGLTTSEVKESLLSSTLHSLTH